MSLIDLIITKEPRDRGGSRASNRLDLQKSWALCQLIELHRNGKDYLLVLELHDDVLVLDSSSDPKFIDFYQIKSKEDGKHWTLAALTTPRKGAKGPLSSHLGRLYSNLVTFKDHTRTLNFVSNQAFQLSVSGSASSTTQEACLSALTRDLQRKIAKALRKEHKLDKDPECSAITYLRFTPLSRDGHADQALANLTKYLDELHPDEKHATVPLFRTLVGEIVRRSNVEVPRSLSEKSISRPEFEEMLKKARPSSQLNEFLKDSIDFLIGEGMGWDGVRGLRSAIQTYEVESMMPDAILAKAIHAVKTVVMARAKQGFPATLTKTLADTRTALGPKARQIERMKSPDYLSAMILVTLYDTNQLQTPTS